MLWVLEKVRFWRWPTVFRALTFGFLSFVTITRFEQKWVHGSQSHAVICCRRWKIGWISIEQTESNKPKPSDATNIKAKRVFFSGTLVYPQKAAYIETPDMLAVFSHGGFGPNGLVGDQDGLLYGGGLWNEPWAWLGVLRPEQCQWTVLQTLQWLATVDWVWDGGGRRVGEILQAHWACFFLIFKLQTNLLSVLTRVFRHKVDFF